MKKKKKFVMFFFYQTSKVYRPYLKLAYILIKYNFNIFHEKLYLKSENNFFQNKTKNIKKSLKIMQLTENHLICIFLRI